jgi:aminoglycoside phosphotransferase (APT) family kinase protein
MAIVDYGNLIDLPKLQLWMDDQGLGDGPITSVRTLAGGTQNILLRYERNGRDYVLRRTALAPRPGADRSIAREAQILSALAGSDVPHPRLYAACPDPEILGAAFYLMEPVEGFNPTTMMPALHASDPGIRRQMAFALVDGAAALSRVDPTLPALNGFGNPENFLGRQVTRWRAVLTGYDAQPDWPGLKELPGIHALGDCLDADIPDTFQPGVMHGDYHFANVMFCNNSPRIAAIVDWELSTIGDPLLDLAWIVACWRGPPEDDVDLIKINPRDGFPGPDELIEHYGEVTGRDLSTFNWYLGLACYKLAIVIEGTFVRALRGEASMETGKWFHGCAQQLLRRGQRSVGI